MFEKLYGNFWHIFYSADYLHFIESKSDLFIIKNQDFQFAFQKIAKSAISLKHAPYGGLPNHDFEQLYNTTIKQLYNRNINKLIIKQPPQGLLLNPIVTHLDVSHFTNIKTTTDYHYIIAVNSLPFNQICSRGARHKLNLMSRMGVYCQKLTTDYLPAAFDLIRLNRTKRGHPLNTNLPDLQNLFFIFPENYHLFGCFTTNHQLVGVAVIIKVSAAVLYCFLLAHHPNSERFSPVTCLISHIYAFAQTNGIAQIDLGASGSDGVENLGLAQYKKSLGGIAHPKQVMEIEIPNNY